MIITRTPFRISFFGGGTDYPEYFKDYAGASLTTSIDKYCYITCRKLPPFFEHKTRLAYSKIEAVKDNSDLEHPAVRETLRFMGVTEGLEIHHDADLPARTGLGSSSAFTVGLLNCLYHMKGRPQTKQTLALQAIDIERNYCKEHVGCQDQVATALGGLNHLKFKFIDGQPNYECNKVKISQTRIAELERHLMLFFTGFSRTASEIAKYQLANLPQKLSEMGRMYQMVSEAIDILHTGDIMSFGELLHEAWLIKRDLSDKVSNYVIDQYYSNAIMAGATGGKILGAGGGGFLLLFVHPERQPNVRHVLRDLIEVDFKFENTGTELIFNHE